MDKLIRGIDENFARVFKKDHAFKLLDEYPEELFLGIRNNYINIYYRAASICKGKVSGGRFTAEIAKRYLNINEKQGYVNISGDELVDNYERIKHNIDTHYAEKNKEKDAQQRLVMNNNANSASEWVCIDIEYKRQRVSSEETDPGRFDIIAITKTLPHRVALIELKYGSAAIGGSSGVLKHTADWLRFNSEGQFCSHLIPEIVSIIRSYCLLRSDFPIQGIAEDMLSKEPEFYFITLDNAEDRARQTMLRYIRNDVEGFSRNNVVDVLGIDITKANKENFTPGFLFAEGGGENITHIIGDSNYRQGFDLIENMSWEELGAKYVIT